MIQIENALKSLTPNAQFAVYDDGTIDWLSPDIDQPTEEAIQAKLAELQADFDSKQYQRDRSTSYPSLQDQLDMQYWDSVNGTTTWKDAIAKVKTDIPKPE